MFHKRNLGWVAAVATTAIVFGATGAVAGDLINSKDIQNDTLRSVDVRDNNLRGRDIRDGSITGKDIKPGTLVEGMKGDKGEKGDVGPAGPKGATGDNGMLGAYYSVAFYDVGDTNAGAIATVACSNVTDVAISGGVQTLGLDGTPLDNNTPVASSFPGRMDYNVNAPKPGRLDGWIIQFGGNAGAVSDNPPLRAKVWALCLPNGNVPVVQTYLQSS